MTVKNNSMTNHRFGPKAWGRILGILIALNVFSQANAIAPFVIKDIKVQGLQRIELSTFFTYLPIKVGEVLDDVRAPMVVRGLFKSGAFEEIELARDGDTLVIVVRERPVIASLTFEGNKAIKTEDLKEGLKNQGLAKGEVLNPAMLEDVKRELEKQYFAFGKYGVRVRYQVTYLPRNRASVKFIVHEGEAATIADINIVGNQAFSDEALLKQFELSTGGWFSFLTNDNQYAKEKLSGDLEKLRSFYRDRGYLKFNITSTQVAITPRKDKVFITINVEEGDKYTVSDVKFSGKPILDEKLLKVLFPVKKGEVYSGGLVTFGQENIAKALGRSGYAFANVSTIPTIDEEKKTVALNVFIDPGKRVYVRRISFAGNEKTNDHVLRREMRLMESGPLSTDLVDRSKLRLERLPFFEEVNVETKPVAGSDDLVDIQFTVKERPSGNIGGGVGYSDVQGAIINANIRQDNFLGSGRSVAFDINSSAAIKSANISYTDPYATIDGISVGANVFYSQSDFSKLNLAGQSLDRVGIGLNYGIPLDEVTRLNFGIAAQDSTLKTDADKGVLVSEPIRQFFASVDKDPAIEPDLDFQVATASVAVIRNTFNRGIFPDKGTLQSVRFDVAVPGGTFEYFKVDYRYEHYFPITDGWTLLGRLQLSYGDAYGSQSKKLPYFENFYAGGVATLRGFDANTVGPREFFLRRQNVGELPSEDGGDLGGSVFGDLEDALVTFNRRSVGGNARVLGGLELIFPTPFAEGSRSVRTSFFVDVGHVWDTKFNRDDYRFLAPEQFELIPDYSDPTRYRASYGLSIQWISPMGPLIFSLARPLKKEPGDRTESFAFNIGRTF